MGTGGRLAFGAEMLIEADRNTLFEGEAVAYRITVVDQVRIAESITPLFGKMDDFRVDYHGRQDQNRQFLSSLNGQTTRSVQYISQFTYEIYPLKTGKIPIPAPRLMYDGKTLTPSRVVVEGRLYSSDTGGGNQGTVPVPVGSLPLQVMPQDRQDVVLLRIESDRETVYPLQPFTILLKVLVKGGSREPFSDRNPLGILEESPRLLIPWVESGSLPAGLRPESDRESWLSPFESTRGGFAVNDLKQRSFFPSDDFFGLSPMGGSRQSDRRFSFPMERVAQPNADGVNTPYWQYTLKRTFTAERLGTLDFGPVSIKGRFAVVDPENPSRLKLQPIYAITPRISVQVRDVPADDRPKDYIGAFGRFDWHVDLQPRTAGVGQPLDLTLTLSGQGSTVNVEPPDLTKIPEIDSNFRVYTPQERIDERQCEFVYTIRPRKGGKIVFPPIGITYFDVETESFVTRRSEPIAIDVEESEKLADIPPLLPGARGAGSKERLALKEGILANTTDPVGAVNHAPSLVEASISIASPFLLYFLVMLGVFCRRRASGDLRARQRRRAVPKARERLKNILSKSRETSHRRTPSADMVRPDFFSEMQSVFAGLVADLAGIREQGLTTADICSGLETLRITPACIERARSLLEQLDAAKYGGINRSRTNETLVEAENLFLDLERQLKKPRTDSAPPVVRFVVPFAVVLSLFSCTLSGCTFSPASEASGLFVQAQSAFDAADAETDPRRRREGFEKAALAYQRLLDRHIENALLFYNQGNAWAKADEPIKAIASYRRALRFEPLNGAVRQNLAAIAPPASKEPVESWFETLFFWQNVVGYHRLYMIAVLSAWITSGFGVLALFYRNKPLHRLTRLLAVPTLIGIVSFAYDYYRYEMVDYAIVAVEGATVRKGNSLNYEPSFMTAADKGSEAVVLEHRGNWCHLRFIDGQEGWLPDSDIVIY
ncbi:MAG TPA: hypothetical protein DEB39_15650 [Planctomycetaceae bacterium]|nr:hypothetical protein [Planctomycetaceae bacterium]